MRTSLHLEMFCSLGLLTVCAAHAQAFGPIDSVAGSASIGPDLVVGGLYSTRSYGGEEEISAFSFGPIICNMGDEPAVYRAFTNEHPIITLNLYRLKNDRFEQIGMSWVYHTFLALAGNYCNAGCQNPSNGLLLGAGCSEPESAAILGLQSYLAPRFSVNAHTGDFPYPPTELEGECDPCSLVDRRLQVRDTDLDPALNAEALYFVEGHILSPDDATAGNQNNNVSYRQTEFFYDTYNESYGVAIRDTTKVEQAAIRAWRNHDPSVVETDIQIPGEGLLILAAKATDLGTGLWRYEYALQNVNSDRSVRSFKIPLPRFAHIHNIEFHDVDYHSGDPFDLTDWPTMKSDTSLSWATDTYEINANANALRWGTLYNFRFDARACPASTTVSLSLFKPGVDSDISVRTTGPEVRNLGDFTKDCVVDLDDLSGFTTCLSGPGIEAHAVCLDGDLNDDTHVDLIDIATWQSRFTRP